MDKQLIEGIALEVAKEIYLGENQSWRKDGIINEFATRFLSRIDAERGKEAVAKVLVHYNYGPDYKASVEWLTDYRLAPDTPLFISPTIPEGMAKDAARFRWMLENPDRAASLLDGIGPSYWCSELDRFIVTA